MKKKENQTEITEILEILKDIKQLLGRQQFDLQTRQTETTTEMKKMSNVASGILNILKNSQQSFTKK